LLLGSPGIGKSTFCKYVVSRFCAQSGDTDSNETEKGTDVSKYLRDKFDLLVWLPLADAVNSYELKQGASLGDLLLAQFHQEGLFEEERAAAVELILKSKTLFVLDGYDEAARKFSAVGGKHPVQSIIERICEQKHVLMTSRSTTRADLLTFRFHRHLELTGFGQTEIDQYLKARFGSEDGVALKLKTFLQGNPSLYTMSRVPLLLEMICQVRVRDGESSNVDTASASAIAWLYYEMADKLHFERNVDIDSKVVGKGDRSGDYMWLCGAFLQFVAIEATAKDALLINHTIIGKALTAFWESQQPEIKECRDSVVVYEDLSLSRRHIKKVNRFILEAASTSNGLLKNATVGMGNTGISTDILQHSFYFMHLTFQEYFTAEFVAAAYCSGPDSTEYKRAYDMFDKHKHDEGYVMVWRLTAGLLGLKSKADVGFHRFMDAVLGLSLDDDVKAPPAIQHKPVRASQFRLVSNCLLEIQPHQLSAKQQEYLSNNYNTYCRVTKTVPKARPDRVRNLLSAVVRAGSISFLTFFLKDAKTRDARLHPERERTVAREALPLMLIAAQNGHLAVVEKLIEHKATVNASSTDGWTALMLAAENGHLAVVEELIEHKADLNAESLDASDFGETALIAADKNSHLSTVKSLIEGKADVVASAQRHIFAANLALVCDAAVHAHGGIVGLMVTATGNTFLRDKFGTDMIFAITSAGGPSGVEGCSTCAKLVATGATD
jgi:hypothetical protein